MLPSLKYPSKLSGSLLRARVFGPTSVNSNLRYKNIRITDIPVMITESGKILCIPETNEVKHIGVTGMTGTCKSLTINALLSWDYWLQKKICVNINDMQRDTFEWSLPCDTPQFIHTLQKINALPMPTPLVYVFPSTNTLQIEESDKTFPFLKMTIPLKEVIRNLDHFYSLDKTKVYVTNLIDELSECSSQTELMQVIDDNIHEKHRMMKYKISNIFQSIFNSKMIDFAVPEAPSQLLYSDKDGNKYFNFTIQTLMRSGIVPSIQTTDLRNHDFFSPYMAFIINTIYNKQYTDEFFKKKTISLFVDEIDKMWKGDNGELVKSALGLIGTNGRSARIGLRWSTQHYNLVPDQIRGNTKYLFISRKSSAKEVNDIRADFDIPKSMDGDILNLTVDRFHGLFELVAVTTENFVLYDATTGERTYTNLPQKGYLIPPIAKHKVPQQ